MIILFERILNGQMLKTLVIGVQGQISRGGGSRIQIILGEHTLIIHTHHDNNDAVNKKGTGDSEKAKSTEIFYAKWKETEANEKHKDIQKDCMEKFG